MPSPLVFKLPSQDSFPLCVFGDYSIVILREGKSVDDILIALMMTGIEERLVSEGEVQVSFIVIALKKQNKETQESI